jgi:hypothetical protein
MSMNNKGKRKANQQPTGQSAAKKQKTKNVAGRNSQINMTTSVPAAFATTQRTSKPKIVRQGNNSVRIIHRELVGTVIGSTAFTVAAAIPLNPGLPSSYPWLSTQAVGWEKYEFMSQRLRTYTRTGSNVPGSEIIAVDYDAADSAPGSESIVAAFHGTVEDAPWKDIVLTMDPTELKGRRFLRYGALGPNLDIKTYDVGTGYICTVDGTAVNWGKTWIEYDVVLYNQQLPAGGSTGAGTLAAAGGSLAAATPFGAVPVALGLFSLNAAATNVVTATNLAIGTEYAVSIASSGTVMSGASLSTFVGFTNKNGVTGANTGATNLVYAYTLVATATSGSFVVNMTATTVTASSLVFTALTITPSF